MWEAGHSAQRDRALIRTHTPRAGSAQNIHPPSRTLSPTSAELPPRAGTILRLWLAFPKHKLPEDLGQCSPVHHAYGAQRGSQSSLTVTEMGRKAAHAVQRARDSTVHRKFMLESLNRATAQSCCQQHAPHLCPHRASFLHRVLSDFAPGGHSCSMCAPPLLTLLLEGCS
jgi:hypothetical protein